MPDDLEKNDNKNGLAPKKSLGQNFLTSPAAFARIVDAADIRPGETVLEIGPGKGGLTERLLEAGGNVTAIEKDARLIPFLREKFAKEIESGALSLLERDALEFDTGEIKSGYKLVANIPYYITGAIIRKFLSSGRKPSAMVLLVQREVAERIAAKDGKESLLSLSIKAYGKPTMAGVVHAGSFFPKPSVDSAILVVRGISDEFFAGINEEDFFKAIHAGFAQKRKMLRRNLEAAFEKSAIERAFEGADLLPTVRAEDLSLEEWGKLVRNLSS
ncbi:MAG TPA: 16S rRNA (adenine(1518)-N(6)/adenine(1519)-N(6))-dimethyltransferase RsmA [Candidatus Paceibacterota bacterium]|jgi:16S rRNA (adenine1518-N6/adenine1519-N6)-dimethyltransferase|nr:16S rRNA (adenine(1518)-N(6)/adenine(1519)-N(6))-dimethyltransferase RsmA [Candidatus Paceibacterota bacterium]